MTEAICLSEQSSVGSIQGAVVSCEPLRSFFDLEGFNFGLCFTTKENRGFVKSTK
jgi:hypothetical protein